MITIKLKLKNTFGEAELIKQFNNVIRFAYNRYADGNIKKDSEIVRLIKSTMNHIDKLDSAMIEEAVKRAKHIFNIQKSHGTEKIIFGGKSNWNRYNKGLISKEEFEENKLLPLYSVGSHGSRGNRKFELDLKNNHVLFKKSRSEHFDLYFHNPSKNQKLLLDKLQDLYDKDKHLTCFTVQLSKEYIWITFDEIPFAEKTFVSKKGRIASIDMNPNYIALVIQDEDGTIILKELFSTKAINDFDKRKHYENRENKTKWRSHLNNKRKHETLQISKQIINLCIHYKVESFLIEDLNIKSKDSGKGKAFNKLCLNHWDRNLLFNNLQKRCNLNGIEFDPVFAGYSSIKGQLEHEDEVDSIAAAIEIGQRKNKDLRNMKSTQVDMGMLSNRWKKEITSNFNHVPTWDEISSFLKKKFKNSSYRNFFSEDNPNIGVSFSFKSVHSYVKTYVFI